MQAKYWAVVGALLIAELAAIFESTMIYSALPTLIRELGDPVTAGWLITSNALIGTSAALMAGRLGDIYGRRRVLLHTMAIAVVGSIISAVSSEFLLVLFGRALQGCAAALVPLSIGIIRENVERRRVPVAIGLMTTGMGIGTSLGLVLGGWIVDNHPWHVLFIFSAGFLAIAWAGIRFLIPDHKGTPPVNPIDWIEGVLPVPGITLTLLGISLSSRMGWLNATVLPLIAAGLAIMFYWARRSLRAVEPFINLRLLAQRNVLVVICMAVLLSLGAMQITLVFSAYTQNPTWTMAGLGMSATVAGIAKLPSNMLSYTAGPMAGWLQQKWGIRQPILLAGMMGTVGWALAMLFPTNIVQVVLLLCLISYGTSMLNAAMPNVVVVSVPEERTSEAIGAVSVLRSMAHSIGSQIMAVMLAVGAVVSSDGGARIPSGTGFRLAMATITVLTLFAALGALLLRPPAAQDGEDGERQPAPT